MVEINHDHCPEGDQELLFWAKEFARYLRTGDVVYLPKGVTFFNMRHHSDPCPLGEPPQGWGNMGVSSENA